MARTSVRASSLHPTSAKSTPVWLAGCLEIVDKRSFQRPRRAKEAQHKLGRGHVTRGRNNRREILEPESKLELATWV
ncbi:hypothetical protein PABG_05288 [Paracoccidioides brasiliensis Pb03]|nr:hypothetical protein PABG_05288 [Paracoccidioides brasiliensis Pb03]